MRPTTAAATVVPTSGGHPRSATLISRFRCPDLGWSRKPQMALATHLVGRASELDSVDRLLAEVAAGTIRGARVGRASPESARRAFSPSWPPVPTHAGTSSSRAGPGSSSSTCRSGSSSTRSTSTSTASTRSASDDLDDDVRAELATVFPSLAGLAIGRTTAIQHERYRSHRAVCALLETLAQTQPVAARAGRRPLGGSGVGRVARRAPPSTAGRSGAHRDWPCGRARWATGSAPRSNGRTAPARSCASTSKRSAPRMRAS